jgi:glucose/arabinose dehydrogenase
VGVSFRRRAVLSGGYALTDPQLAEIVSSLQVPGLNPRQFRSRLLGAAVMLAVVVTVTGCAVTDPPAEVTDRAATLGAHVFAGGKQTTYWFEYGTSTSYDHATTHRDGGSSSDGVKVTERVTGLSADTTYHYRACTTDPDETSCGTDVTFRTGSPGMLPGFQQTVAFSGLTEPTAVRFAPDGRVFVAEKSGLIKVFDGLTDTTPTTFADLRTKVHNFWDRGLLGLALDPDFPAKPFVYALYTYDAAIGGTAPRWGVAGQTSDGCPTPPGPTTDGCVVSGRLSRLEAIGGGNTSGPEQVLIEDWCQQFPSHSIGDLAFGPDGALYVSGGEGASFDFPDWGQYGSPTKNPCGDPPTGAGGNQTVPTAEGGTLRSQDIRTTADPTGLSGAILRVDPDTGAALPDNPNASSTDDKARRIIAYGFRNPFRFTLRPGTNDPWVGDVGPGSYEEIDRLIKPPGVIENFGWPCYEGSQRNGDYDGFDLSLCESLYTSGTARGPFFSYLHTNHVDPEDDCEPGSSAISGLAFTPSNSTLPAELAGALFFADYSRGCIWVMERAGGSLPSPSRVHAFRAPADGVVDLQFGPDGDLYYPDLDHGQIKRIHYAAGDQAPRAVIAATPTNGAVPLHVDFSATGSSDPDSGDTLSYEWDLDGDGAFDDATGSTAQYTYTSAGRYLASVRVTDNHGASATDAAAISAGNTPPTATISSPSTGLTWKVGDAITFSGSARDTQDGNLAASALSWKLTMEHCPSNCHEHVVQSWSGIASGSFVAPDHEYPSYLVLELTATDSGGLTDTQTIPLYPKTVVLSFSSTPSGLTLTLNSTNAATPFSRTVIQNSVNGLSAPTPQTLSGSTYDFTSWSDGGARVHSITATGNRSLSATYTKR